MNTLPKIQCFHVNPKHHIVEATNGPLCMEYNTEKKEVLSCNVTTEHPFYELLLSAAKGGAA